jgi:hypothetical protein
MNFRHRSLDERFVPRRSRWSIVSPGEGGVEDHGQGGERRAVAIVQRLVGVRIAEAVAPQHVVPPHVSADGLGGIKGPAAAFPTDTGGPAMFSCFTLLRAVIDVQR